MMQNRPMAAQPVLPSDAHPAPWDEARRRLELAETYWFATRHPDGRPHVRPVLAVWTDGALFLAASPDSQKAKNLVRDARCTLSTTHDGLDLVGEGTATKMDGEADLQRIAAAYLTKYGWQVSIRGGAFYADGAPTAGPPPYEVYEIRLSTVFAFPATKEITPTRWRF